MRSKPSPFKSFLFALFLSTLLNAAGIFTLTELSSYPRIPQKSKEKEIFFDLRFLPPQHIFVDTPLKTKPSERDTDMLSDKDSQADSSAQGEETGLLPQSTNKDLLPQASRNAQSISPPLFLQQHLEKVIEKVETEQKKVTEKMTEEGLQLMEEKKLVEEESLMQEDILETPSLPPSFQSADDFFPLSLISLGNLKKNGQDSFETKGNALGKYLKTMREKIGLHFYKMLFFHYRTNYIFGSKAKVTFLIEPEGSVRDLRVEFVKGDPLFAEYCTTVIRNAEPFMPLHKDLTPTLEDGALKIDFLFGVDLRKGDKE
jgi:hypothetical protein